VCANAYYSASGVKGAGDGFKGFAVDVVSIGGGTAHEALDEAE
jgi:hypothetical protein